MQTDDLENQVSTSFTLLSYQRLTMPAREKGTIDGVVSRGGLLSKPQFAAQLLRDQAITYPIQPQFLNSPIQTHQNGYSNKVVRSSQFLSNTVRPTSVLETVSPGDRGVNVTGWGLCNQQTLRLKVVTSPTQQRSTLRELPHLVGYMVGAVTIFGLYLIIPLLILLNATLPGNWNGLIIALGILALAELVVVLILIKTTLRGKRKKENVLVQR